MNNHTSSNVLRHLVLVFMLLVFATSFILCRADIPLDIIDTLASDERSELISAVSVSIARKRAGIDMPCYNSTIGIDLMELPLEELVELKDILLSTNETNESNDSNKQSDDIDYSVLADFFDRQKEYESVLEEIASNRIAEYSSTVLLGLDLYLDDAYIFGESEKEHIHTVNVKLRWNVENNVQRTQNMLAMYSDDMAASLHNAYPDIPIDNMYVLWEVPSFIEVGYAAKILYYSIGENMFCADRYGLLYGRG